MNSRSRITFELDDVTRVKLEKRLARSGITLRDAVRMIAAKGERFFSARLIGAIKA